MNVARKPIISMNQLYGSMKYVTIAPMKNTANIKSRYDYEYRWYVYKIIIIRYDSTIVVDKIESHQHTWKSVHAKKYFGSKSVWKKYKKKQSRVS